MEIKLSNDQNEDKIKEDLIVWFKTSNPTDVLHAVYNNSNEGLLIPLLKELGLNNGVINVLVHYVSLSFKGDVPYWYFTLIAKHWVENGIVTVEEAMEFAKQENDKLEKIVISNLESIGVIFESIGMLVSINTPDKDLGKAVKELYNKKLFRC